MDPTAPNFADIYFALGGTFDVLATAHAQYAAAKATWWSERRRKIGLMAAIVTASKGTPMRFKSYGA